MLGKSTRIHHHVAGDTPACSSLVLFVCLSLSCLAHPAHAAVVWSGDIVPNYDPAYWTPPTAGYIGKSGHGTMIITADSDVSNGHGIIADESGSSGEVTVDGAGSTWTNEGGLWVGDDGSGTLDIMDGGEVLDDSGHIGNAPGSTGEVTVDGAGSTWTNGYDLTVGIEGNGTLNITGGGVVTVERETSVARVAGSSGTIHFDNGTLTTGALGCSFDDLTGMGTINAHGLYSDGDLLFDATHGLNQTLSINDNPGQNITVNLTVDGSGFLGAGYAGVGTMSIADGRVVESIRGYIGVKSGSTGQVTVDGGGSSWTGSKSLMVGWFGSGTMNITDGGLVNNNASWIGFGAGSTSEVTVDGAGSTWTNSNSLDVGPYGSGTLNITNGGVVSSLSGYIGSLPGSTGVATVDGAGSTWTNNEYLVVGSQGNATLNITNGGTVISKNAGAIGGMPGSTGEATVIGNGSTWTNGNELYVGYESNGTLNITDGGLVSVAGILTIDFDTNSDGFINMATGGMLALFGDADNTLAEFLGLVSGTDAIRWWDDSASDWALLTTATMGTDYTLEYLTEGDLNGYTLLTVDPAVPGDANRDGVVNDADAAVLATYWLTASGALWGMGDFNGDGAVNDIDATLMAANWGSGANAAVPEPSMLVGLLGMCLAGLLGWARRR